MIEALAPVEDDLRELDRLLLGFVPAETRSAQDVLKLALGSGGKRIRPALFFLTSRLFDYRGDHYFPIAAVTEFVHTASLLHDDVVDNSTLRRGKATANSIYGDETSVLVGDLIYSTASGMMAATGNMEIVKTFANAIRLMSDGELLQLENVFNPDVAEATYLRILECKTSVLIEASCRAAALLAGASAADADAVAQFGRAVGLAFQLIDDGLDYTGAAEVLGKPPLADLIEGKVTMPMILLFRTAPTAETAELRKALESGRVDVQLARMARTLVERYETVDATIDRAHEYTREAMSALHRLPASPARDALEHLANRLLFRFH